VAEIIAADSRPVRVLNLPFGVRDGTRSAGNFSAQYQFEQTRHGKALIGGYLSRISARRLAGMIERYPSIGALVAMSEGQALTEDEASRFIEQGLAFAEAADLGYVVIDQAKVTPQLQRLAVDAFRLEPIAADGAMALYRPRDLR
jgi:hypothetical protein